MLRRKPQVITGTPNQIVAHNINKARLLRGWTQDQAAEALERYLGARLSTASWSALERSVDGGRIREFTADELVALARGFDLPIGWFFTPPSAWDGARVGTPDTKGKGLDPVALFDVILGTPDTLAEWEEYLLSWPSPAHRARVAPDGTVEHLGRVEADVHQRLVDPASLRARLLLRQRFGDLDRARDVLAHLSAVIQELDESPSDDSEQPTTTPAARRRK